MRNLQNSIKVNASIRPQANSGGTALGGAAIDTRGFNSGLAVLELGAISGTPTATSISWKVQECSTSDGTFTDVSGWAISGLTAGNQTSTLKLEDLGSERKRFLKVVATITFTGGSSPSILLGADILLGRAYQEPVR